MQFMRGLERLTNSLEQWTSPYRTDRNRVIVMLALLTAYLAPYYIFGTDTRVSKWDYFDFKLGDLVALKASGMAFAPGDATIQSIFNGLRRAGLPSEFDLHTICFLLFKPYTAFLLHRSLLALTALVGMYLLLTKHVDQSDGNKWTAGIVAVCFSTLPFFPSDFSVALPPLILYSFLNLRTGKWNAIDIAVFIVTPSLVRLYYGGIFIIGMFGLILCYDIVTTRKINKPCLLAIIYLCVVSALVQYRLIVDMIFNNTINSQRADYSLLTYSLNFDDAAHELYGFIRKGAPHAPALQTPIIYIAATIALGSFAFHKRLDKWWCIAALFVVISSTLTFMHTWTPSAYWLNLIYKRIPIQIDRLYLLLPAACFVVFFTSLREISKLSKVGTALVLILLSCQLVRGYSNHEHLKAKPQGTYKQFFAENQFDAIRRAIGLPQEDYRVVSLGLFPSIALYNGFYVLDATSDYYSYKYKMDFRKIIAAELDKSPRLKRYFDSAGGVRCYLFSAEIQPTYDLPPKSGTFVRHLDLDYDQLYSMGGRYIISAAEVDTIQNPRLSLVNKFVDDSSAWDIYLYRVLK